jgi:SAM-dependent methyltransferase
MNRFDHVRVNRDVYDRMAAAGNPLCRPATDQEIANPLATIDPAGWLEGSIAGQEVLCLAAGGGRHSSLYAAAGANVTVVDISPAMLELDRQVAAQRGHSLRIVETSMEDLSMLPTASFDIVIQPVSTCYVPDIVAVYQQVANVIRPGGLYVSQHKQPVSLQASTQRHADGGYRIEQRYYRETPIPAPQSFHGAAKRLREAGAVEYLHRWEQIIGGMCNSGFAIEALSEPRHDGHNETSTIGSSPHTANLKTASLNTASTFADRAAFIAPYVRVKARRVDSTATSTKRFILS